MSSSASTSSSTSEKSTKLKPTKEQEALWQSISGLVEYNGNVVKQMHLLECDPIPEPDARGRRRVDGFQIAWEGKVFKEWANLVNCLHGAAAAWIVDTCTSATIIAIHTEKFWGMPMMSGVSLSLNMEYYHPAPLGTKLKIVCTIVKISETMAHTVCDIHDFNTGKLYCRGTHMKAWKGPQAKL